jgi:hypothetical protein
MLREIPEDALVLEALRDRSGEDCWSERTAELLRAWGEQWDRAAVYHLKWSQMCALSHFALAGPAVVLPLIFQEALPPETLRVGFLCCSLLAALLSFLNFNALSTRHLLASHSYTALRHDLLCEMARPPRARRLASLAMADFKSRRQQVLMASPGIPMRCWCPFMPAARTDFPDQSGLEP